MTVCLKGLCIITCLKHFLSKIFLKNNKCVYILPISLFYLVGVEELSNVSVGIDFVLILSFVFLFTVYLLVFYGLVCVPVQILCFAPSWNEVRSVNTLLLSMCFFFSLFMFKHILGLI